MEGEFFYAANATTGANHAITVKPITMAWDERGRLWICESVDYPNDIHPGTPGRDRIKILEDTNGDGRADKIGNAPAAGADDGGLRYRGARRHDP